MAVTSKKDEAKLLDVVEDDIVEEVLFLLSDR